MPTQVNRTTFEILRSVSGSPVQFPPASWITFPNAGSEVNLTALIGSGSDVEPEIPKIYWVAETSDVREMTGPEKAGVDSDAGEVAIARGKRRFELQVETDQFLQQRYNPAKQRAFMALGHAVVGAQANRLDEWFDWHETVQQALSDAFDEVEAATTIPVVEAVEIDFTTLSGTNPESGDFDVQYIFNG